MDTIYELDACVGCRDDISHTGEKIDWGQWAITGDDPDFNGTGNPDTGEDYGPAPGEPILCQRRTLQSFIAHVT